jgi:ribonuclease BN (tRNA processing enzyme)
MLKRLGRNVIRVGQSFCSVDLVRTSSGLIRVGGMPGLPALLKKNKLNCDHVVVLPPEISMSGDSHAGEETVLWNEFHSARPKTRTYVGEARDLNNLMRRVRTGISLRPGPDAVRWAEDPQLRGLVRLVAVPGMSRQVRLGPKVEIHFMDDNIEIIDNHNLVYDFREHQIRRNISYRMEKLFEGLSARSRSQNSFAVFVAGSANGPARRSASFIVQYGRRRIWIDPCAYPLEVLARCGLAADSITDILVTQAAEDHVEGLPALLKRAMETKVRIDLITMPAIYADLKVRINYLFDNKLDRIVNLVNATPLVPLPYHKGLMTTRLNHSFSRHPALGVKFAFNGVEIAFSGDTCYEENAIAAMARPDLGWQWFRNSRIVFHEAAFRDPGPGHSRTVEVTKLKKKIRGKLFIYRASASRLIYPSLCREGAWYELRRGRIRIRRAIRPRRISK